MGNDSVSVIHEDGEGMLSVGTLGGGLNRFDPETERFTRFPFDPEDPQSLGNPFVYSILEHREGRLWIATDAGEHGGCTDSIGQRSGLPISRIA